MDMKLVYFCLPALVVEKYESYLFFSAVQLTLGEGIVRRQLSMETSDAVVSYTFRMPLELA
jgi:hypothetical protein